MMKMQTFISTKVIKAEPSRRKTDVSRLLNLPEERIEWVEGYNVHYKDGGSSWVPKVLFDKTHLGLASENNTISGEDVIAFIKDSESVKIGEKTTMTTVHLINGFELVETSACVDPANFSMEIGHNINMGKIKNKIWFLLGFLLQTGLYGFKGE